MTEWYFSYNIKYLSLKSSNSGFFWWCNDFSQSLGPAVARLILSIYHSSHKKFNKFVGIYVRYLIHHIYIEWKFLGGMISNQKPEFIKKAFFLFLFFFVYLVEIRSSICLSLSLLAYPMLHALVSYHTLGSNILVHILYPPLRGSYLPFTAWMYVSNVSEEAVWIGMETRKVYAISCVLFPYNCFLENVLWVIIFRIVHCMSSP